MNRSQWRNVTLILACLLLGFATANAGVSFNIGLGSDNSYQPVGDYDYLPYAHQIPGYISPPIDFHNMMSQYGVWVNVVPFGQVWKPYASMDWRPYIYGHWISTQQYGQMWEGYEPWAWMGYHYGNWILDRQYGWVWIPGYDWHPGRVAWARSQNTIGWSPLPPAGYDYSRGVLTYIGPRNQYAYEDNDFSAGYDTGNFSYGGPYYDPYYRDLYYNSSYSNISLNLWIFIDNSYYGSDNYADYSLGPNYTQYIFDRRLIRISYRAIEQPVLERVIGQRLQETAIETRELQVDKRTLKVVIPVSKDAVESLRKNSIRVVKEEIAPAFAKWQKSFRGQNSSNKQMVDEIFHQENATPKTQTLSGEQVLEGAWQLRQNHFSQIQERAANAEEKLIQSEKEGRISPPPEPLQEVYANTNDSTQDVKKTSKFTKHEKAKKSKAKEKDKKTNPQNVAEEQH